jgi:dipeptidase E
VRRLFLLLVIFPVVGAADDRPEDARKTLYLTSAAINVLDELIPLLPLQYDGRTDCYIVTAGNLDENPHWIADEIEAIENWGRKVTRIDLAGLAPDTLEEAFRNCGAIWAGGGNTFYLLQEVRRSGFDDLLIRKIREGIPYVGTSAGSIILAPDIGSVRFADDPEQAPDLTSFDGLNLFPLVAFAHFDNPDFKDAYRSILVYALDNDVDFVTLKEKQMIVVDGDLWKIVESTR